MHGQFSQVACFDHPRSSHTSINVYDQCDQTFLYHTLDQIAHCWHSCQLSNLDKCDQTFLYHTLDQIAHCWHSCQLLNDVSSGQRYHHCIPCILDLYSHADNCDQLYIA